METTDYKTIEKEMVSEISFKKTIEIEQSIELMDQLQKAMILGNEHHSKVKIFFYDDNGPKKLETTIWYAGSKYICLKGGRYIPIDHIVDIKF
jgi:hypothetical protein